MSYEISCFTEHQLMYSIFNTPKQLFSYFDSAAAAASNSENQPAHAA